MEPMPRDAPDRIFLGYHRPPLLPAAEWLAHRFARDGEADMHDLLLCTQGGRAARHLLALLAEVCQRQALALIPPQIGTPLELIDALIPPAARSRHVEATTAGRLLAWCAALTTLDDNTLRALAPHRDLAAGDLASRVRTAEMLDDARHDLAGHGLSLSDAADKLEQSAQDFTDTPRWRAIAQIERAYLASLRTQGLADSPGVRLDAVRAGELNTSSRIVLIAAPELPPLVRVALERVRPEAVLLIADPCESARFDDLGTVKPEMFRTTDLREDQIHIADSPSGQAREVESVLRSLAPGTPADDVIIGVPDASVVPSLRTALGPHGVRLRDAAGTAAPRTAPARFLRAVSDLLETRGSRELSALVRHPDVHAWIESRTDAESPPRAGRWLRELDEHLASRPRATLRAPWITDGLSHDGSLAPLCNALGALLGTLWPPGSAPEARPLDLQITAVLAALSRLYETVAVGTDGSPSDVSFRVCRAIAGHAGELSGACRTGAVPLVSTAEAIRLLLALAEGDHVPARSDPDALELVGWLEIALDDAPVCIVTGMNEGSVPRTTPGGPLLPNSARRALGLVSSTSTLGRDAYLLNVLLRCHERVVIIAGRRAIGGDPLTPSRLLFTCDDDALPSRVKLWSEPDTPPDRREQAPPPAKASAFEPMPRVPFNAVTSMPVTSFRSFLRSPYGFFLERVLRLREVGEPPAELEPVALGSLFHDAMHRFAQGPARDATAAPRIHDAMLIALDSALDALFGPSPPGIVRVQAAQLRERLRAVAEVQAARRAQGWKILHAEWTPSSPTPMDSPRGPMLLTGKIDRIDRHESRDAITILDYKVGESAKAPKDTHQQRGRWIDLQLPLYRHLAAELWRASPTPDITLGYIAVPAKPGAAEQMLALWSTADLESADTAARDVISRVLAGEFFDLGDNPPDAGAMGLICGAGLILDDDEDENEEEGDQ